MPKRMFTITALVLFLILILSPFQWLSFFSVAGLAFKPIHLTLGLVIGLVLFEKRRLLWEVVFRGYGSAFVWVYIFYLIWYTLSVIWSGSLSIALPFLVKHIVYFLYFLLLNLLVSKSVFQGSFVPASGIAALTGIALFAGYMIFVFVTQGSNLLSEYIKAILAQDENALLFQFYPVVFNYMAGDLVYLTSLRNAVMGVLIQYILLLLIWQQSLAGRWKPMAWVTILIGIALVVTSVSRSNIITLAIVLLLPVAIILREKNLRISQNKLSAKNVAISMTVAVIVFAVILFTEGNVLFASLAKIIAARIREIAHDPRLVMYQNAISAIEQNIFWGYGIGKQVFDANGKLLTVHNVFLASWLETGLPGMLFSVGWYFVLCMYFLKAIFHSRISLSGIPLYWVVGLLIIPLLRILVSGSAKFTITEWLALALFFGIMRGAQLRESVFLSETGN